MIGKSEDADLPAGELSHLPFPECGKRCAAMHYLGVGECESVCPKKFDERGNPVPISTAEAKP